MKYWTIIGRDNCPWCDKAYTYLIDNGAEVAYINLSDSKNQEFRKTVMSYNIKTVPQVITPEGELVGEYEALVEYLEGK